MNLLLLLINLKDKPSREKDDEYSSDEENIDGDERQQRTDERSDKGSDEHDADQKRIAAKDNGAKKER